jgi:acyl transferase domain-containing protein
VAVSSFGISGTNAHVVLEAPPDSETPVVEPQDGATGRELEATPWLLSAVDETAVRAQARRLNEFVQNRKADLAGVGATLATSRPVFGLRAAVFGANVVERTEALTALSTGQPHPRLVRGAATATGKIVFVFPGQGSQWVGMGAELLDSSTVFAESIARCEDALAPFVDWSLTEMLRADDFALDRVEVVQPALWAVMIALAETWRSLGVEPAAVIGHSQGEIAAAYIAGILTLEDAARIVTLRSKIIAQHLAGHGGMASIALSADSIRDVLADRTELNIAALNGPQSTVVAGAQQPLEELLSTLDERGIRVRRIPVDYASHSAHVDSLESELTAGLAPIDPSPGEIAFYSTVTGTLIEGTELTADYWFRNLRQPVLFHPVVETLVASHHTVFIEPSPNPVLIPALAEFDSPITAIGSLHRNDGTHSRLLTAVAEAWTHGVDVDWAAQFPRARRVPLPTYPFQRTRYWMEGNAIGAESLAAAGQKALNHPLLSARVDQPDRREMLLTGRISLDTHPWLGDHLVAGVLLLPGTAVLEMVVRAGDEVGCDLVEELMLTTPLVVPQSGGIQVRVRVFSTGSDRHTVSMYARSDDVRR